MGNGEGRKVKDGGFQSLVARMERACKDWKDGKGNRGCCRRLRVVKGWERRASEEGWKDGLGPGDKPLSLCSSVELWGRALD